MNKTYVFPLNFLAKRSDMNIESSITVQFPLTNRKLIIPCFRAVNNSFSFQRILII